MSERNFMGNTPTQEKINVDVSSLEHAKTALKDLAIIQDHAVAKTIISHDEIELEEKKSPYTVLELEVPGGHGFMFSVWRDDEGNASFDRIFFSAGSVVTKHEHSVVELVALTKGKISYVIYDEDNNPIGEPTVMDLFDTVET